MNFRDVESYCDRYHEDAFEWVSDSLRNHSLSCSSITLENLNALMITLSCANPLTFAECHFRLREDLPGGGGPWRFLAPPHPNQRDAILYEKDMIIIGGIGCGKTMINSALATFSTAVLCATCLISAHTSTALQIIFNEMEYQINISPLLRSLIPRGNIKRGNYWHIIGPRGNVCHFRISGPTGNQLVGVQINPGGLAIADEAALWENESWKPFFSRLRKGAREVITSVGYGKKDNKFEDFVNEAISPKEMRSRERRNDSSAHYLRVKFQFDRETLPETMWDEHEKQKAITIYGPETGIKYGIWIKGKVGDPEGSVFSATEITSMFQYDRDYLLLRLTWNTKEGVVECQVLRVDEATGVLVQVGRISKENEHGFDAVSWIRLHLPCVPMDAIGYDFGRRQDPGEITIAECMNGTIRGRVRIQLNHASTPIHARILSFLTTRAKLGCGIEASQGNETHPVYDFMSDIGECDMNRVHLYAWQRRIEIKTMPSRKANRLPRIGAAKIVKTIEDQAIDEGKIWRSLKHQATLGIQNLVLSNQWQHANDPEVIREWKGHCSRHVGDGVVYDKEKDHTVEAGRVLYLVVADALGWNFSSHGA